MAPPTSYASLIYLLIALLILRVILKSEGPPEAMSRLDWYAAVAISFGWVVLVVAAIALGGWSLAKKGSKKAWPALIEERSWPWKKESRE